MAGSHEGTRLEEHRYPGRPPVASIAKIAGHIFAGAGDLRIIPISLGVSTWVYELRRDGDIFYLRIWPDTDESFALEALAHALARERGVMAPEVIYWAHRDPLVERSVMVTTRIAGRPLGYDVPAARAREVLIAAGRDIARLNSIPVDGFGWIRREPEEYARLSGDDPTHAAFIRQQIAEYVPILGRSGLLHADEQRAIERLVVEAEQTLAVEQAHLAHGDLDATHIFHEGGVYTGIIDFGEIRGTEPLYDLGHFNLNHADMLPFVLEGYSGVTPLPADHLRRIRLWSLLIGVRRLGRRLLRKSEGASEDPDLAAIRRGLREMGEAAAQSPAA